MARNAENYTPVVEEIEKGGGWARGIRVDVSDEGSVRGAFGEVGRVLGEGADGKEGGEGKEEGKKGKVAAAVFNVGGKFIRKGFLELAVGEFESGWEANGFVIPFPRGLFLWSGRRGAGLFCFLGFSCIMWRYILANLSYFSTSRGAFLFSQAVLPLLLNSTDLTHPPTLIFTGATASVKGSALCASFATGKFALRALAQSLGREFGPKGVHVAHAIIDGVIDIPKTKEWKFEEPDAKISADAVSLFLFFVG